jgi:Dolichyl-phosphate-mannose-protein mannosyltransferase
LLAPPRLYRIWRQSRVVDGPSQGACGVFEGTFNYYLWALAINTIQLSGKTEKGPVSLTDDAHFAQILFLCRIMTVAFDVLAIFVVFLAVYEATQSFFPAWFSGFLYAIIPMQVIYAHFMRTHVLSNLLCALVLWLSLRCLKQEKRWILILAGFVSGLAAATRFPNGIIVVVPCLCVLFGQRDSLPSGQTRFRERAKRFVAGPVWWIGLGFLVGLFLGHPMLFFDLQSVINSMKGSVLPYVSLGEFKPSNLLNLSVVWKYGSFLIPIAMCPFLWPLPYCAILYLCFRRSLYRQSLPILIFSGLYLYFMAKGYLGPYFARATMLLFPGFCILVGLAGHDLWLSLRKHRVAAICFITAPLVLALPSIAFDLAYAKAMQQRDVRSAFREDLQKFIGDSAVTIGIQNYGGYYYTILPALEPLKSENVVVQLQDPGKKADFFLVGFQRPIDSTKRDATVRSIEKQGNFKYERSYRNCPRIFGWEIPLSGFPIDMTFPFPTILLFQSPNSKAGL